MSIIGQFVLQNIPASVAKPSPNIGSLFGTLGLNMMNFCKMFNAKTTAIRSEVPMQVKLLPTTDKNYQFYVKTPPATWFLKRVAGLYCCSSHPGHGRPCAMVTKKAIYHIALAKCMDPNWIHLSLESICKQLTSTAESMGIAVVTTVPASQMALGLTRRPSSLENLKKEARQRRKLQKRK